MAAASDSVVTVFGGTGFLGRRIVRHLLIATVYGTSANLSHYTFSDSQMTQIANDPGRGIPIQGGVITERLNGRRSEPRTQVGVSAACGILSPAS